MWREILPVGRTSGRTIGYSLCFRWETARCAITILIYVMIYAWLRLVRDLERTRLENMWQRNLGKSYVEWLWMGKRMKMFVSFVNTYQKVNSAGKNFNNQVIRMIHLWIPVVLFSQPPLSLPNRLMNNVAMMARMEDMHGLGNMDFHSPKWTAECLNCQQQRPTVCPQ